MNERVKKLWIEALTSGEYEQGTEGLRSDGHFCCLGVLCDLHREEVGEKDWLQLEGAPFKMYYNQTTYLPQVVLEWAQLHSPNPRVDDETLAYHNDHGKTFPEIAKLIEANL